MAPFCGWGFNCLKTTEPLRGGSLLFTTKFPDNPGTHLILKFLLQILDQIGEGQCFGKTLIGCKKGICTPFCCLTWISVVIRLCSKDFI